MPSRDPSRKTQPAPVMEVAAGPDAATMLEMYQRMVLSRTLDDRIWALYRQGVLGLAVSGQGHEACQVGSVYALRRGYDWLVPYYRDNGVAVAAGLSPRDMMLTYYAKANDPTSGGKHFPAHYADPGLGIVSSSSNVATQIPHAVGLALAAKMRGEDRIAIVYFGDGATSKGDFHESCNFAAVHRLPVIFFCENNDYAISTPRRLQMATETIAARAEGYGFPGVTVDGNDVLAVYHATREAADRARRDEGPTLIEAKTYRFSPHTSNDPDRAYRTHEEIEAHRAQDPILRFRRYLEESGLLPPEREEEVRRQAVAAVDDATEYAQNSPDPAPEGALENVYGS